MVIDTCPFADSFGNGNVISLSHQSYEVCELKIGASPFDSGIRFFACENREEVIRISVRSNPLCTEKVLIELCDAMGSSSEPTIGEGCSGNTWCCAFGFLFAR